jgi:FliI/YscN family ATPase
MTAMRLFAEEMNRLGSVEPAELSGTVSEIIGLAARVRGISASVGSMLEIYTRQGEIVEAEAIAAQDDETVIMPFGPTRGLAAGDRAVLKTASQSVEVSDALLGRILDGRGRPIDGRGPIPAGRRWPLYSAAPDALRRRRIVEPLPTGIRSIDAMCTAGKGQRMGLFSGSGVGKSVLLGMIARYTAADVTVIALVGERGREVREFIERDLGEEGLKRSVVVVATSDKPALMRVKAPFTATAIADYFRSRGKDVFLLMDSITRMAFAQREIGLSAGEPPATKGYPPSVFAMMPQLLERAGMGEYGSITGFYTVLVEADDMSEPISDSARGILDGHVWLSRDIANRGHYPAVDPLSSISRVMTDVTTSEHKRAREKAIRILANYRSSEDLINIGAYVKGSNPEIDEALKYIQNLNAFLRQRIEEGAKFEDTVERFVELMEISG